MFYHLSKSVQSAECVTFFPQSIRNVAAASLGSSSPRTCPEPAQTVCGSNKLLLSRVLPTRCYQALLVAPAKAHSQHYTVCVPG